MSRIRQYPIYFFLSLCLALLCFGENAPKPVWIGEVVTVTDGDTIGVAHDGTPETIRLFGIDAPEEHQPFASHSKEFVSGLCFGQTVTVQPIETDKYGRTVANVMLLQNRRNLSQEIVKNGYAWWYKEYAPKDIKLQGLQLDALTSDKGLWSDSGAIAPWDWRVGKRSSMPSSPAPYSTPYVLAPPPVQTVAPAPQAELPIAVAPAPAPMRTQRAQQPQSLYSKPQPPRATQSVGGSGTVYITKTGEKYHAAGCRYLAKSMIPISLSEAQARNGPCSVCRP